MIKKGYAIITIPSAWIVFQRYYDFLSDNIMGILFGWDYLEVE